MTISDLGVLSRLLIASGVTGDAIGKYQEFLLTDEGISIPAPEQSTGLARTVGRAFAGLPENKVIAAADIPGAGAFKTLLALRTSVAGSPLSMLTLTLKRMPTANLASPDYVLFLGASRP